MMVGIPVSVLFSGFIFPLGVLLYWFTSNVWTMAQQFYIHRFHPHPGGPNAKAPIRGGEGAVEPDAGRALAPKPGARPDRVKGSRPTPRPASEPTAAEVHPEPAAVPTEAVKPVTNRPASRPPRPQGNRPGTKRTPSKKRR
jgi:YidC/Oxa1 family membrane protein insertase